MVNNTPVIYVVDDSPTQLELVKSYLESCDYEIRTYVGGSEFIKDENLIAPGCILLDNWMPEVSGIEVQDELEKRHLQLPIIFMSGESSYEDVFHATQNGAFAFLQKPFRKEKLMEIVAQALEKSLEILAKQADGNRDQILYNKLTGREKEIFQLLVDGKHNKMISNLLDISLRTVEFHRANIQKKLKANYLSDLISLSKNVQP